LLSLPSSLPGRKAVGGGAAALLAVLALAGPAGASTSTAASGDTGGSTTSFNFAYSWGASGLDSGFTMIERKAG